MTAETSGPHEFYRNASGECKDCGHPGPVSPEARKAGIWGFTGVVLCGRCGSVAEVILEELKKPPATQWEAWFGAEPRKESRASDNPTCPECGGGELFLAPSEGGVHCPWCKDGRLEGAPTWIS